MMRLALGLGLLPLAAVAETVSFSGTWEGGSPTGVPTIPSPAGTNVTSYSSYPGYTYNYSLFTFTVTESGNYSAVVGTTNVVNTSWFLTGLFSPGTTPSTDLSAFFAGIFSGSTLTDGYYNGSYSSVTLNEGITYSILLAYNSTSPSMVSGYQMLLSGPGCAAFASLTSCSANILPGTASATSGLGSSVLPAFEGGTLLVDTSGQTYGQNFTLGATTGNTIDSNGQRVTFSGVFSDAGAPGSLTFANSGRGGGVTLTGASTYTGTTTVNAGAALSVNGSLVSPVTVNGGGLLRGTGSVGGIVAANGAVIAPGNSPGTLTSTGPVTFQPRALALFEIDGTGTGTGAGNYSRLVATGAAGTFAAGGLLVPQLRGIAGSATNTFTPGIGALFRVISAQGGVTGSFAGLVQPAGLAEGTRFDALYSPQAIDLVVTPSLYGTSSLAGWAAPVGRALDNARPAAGLAMTAEQAAVYAPLYQLTAAQLPSALQQMAPLVYADSMMLQRSAFHGASSVIGAELRSQRGAPAAGRSNAIAGAGGFTTWLSASGEFARQDNAGNGTPGYHGSTGGVVVGIDRALTPEMRLGVAVAFGSQTVNSGNQARYSGQSAQVMGYGSLERAGYFLDGTLGVAFNEGSFRRTLSAYGTSVKADSSGTVAGGSLRAGRRFAFDGWNIEPSVTLRGLALSNDSARETRGGQPSLRVDGGSLGSLETQVGAQLDRRFQLSGGYAVTASAELGWAHEMLDTHAKVTASFLGLAGSGFTIGNARTSRDAVVAGAIATLETGAPLRAFIGYDVRAGERYTSQSVTGGLRYNF